ncbi:MAG: hypothetical protein NTY01_07700 [Verrucomicrobia bacterium]|nr:hypothetical protein [Verrucomicrobiota bacterium]
MVTTRHEELITMLALILVCVLSFLVLVWHSRLVGITLGLPIAYLFAAHFQYLPGAFAHAVSGDFFVDSSATQIGLEFTTIGTICFVTGVILAQRVMRGAVVKSDTPWLQQGGMLRFAVYCLWGGWLVVYVASFLDRIPSLGAAIDQGALVWIMGVLIGFLTAVRQRRTGPVFLWLAALSVYPLYVLIWGGFLSFGSTSIFVVMSALVVTSKSHLRAYTVLALFSLLSFHVFLSYIQKRSDFRETARQGAGLEERVARAARMFTDLEWFNPSNPGQLNGLDMRLNQSQFVGMAFANIKSGHVDFLHGRSVWEGLQAMVPRMLWPDKPHFAGSSQIIREVSGFAVNETTTYGVGQVLELYANFGVSGIVFGLLLFGFAYGWIDRKVVVTLQNGDLGGVFVWFLMGVAILTPLGSIAEVVGNTSAAAVAAYGWRYAWSVVGANTPAKRPRRKRVAGNVRQNDEVAPVESK